MNMMTQTKWLEGRRELYWFLLIQLSNVLSSDFVLLPVALLAVKHGEVHEF